MSYFVSYNILFEAMTCYLTNPLSTETRYELLERTIKDMNESIIAFQEVGKNEYNMIKYILDNHVMIYKPTTDVCSEENMEFMKKRDGMSSALVIPNTYTVIDKGVVNLVDYFNVPDDAENIKLFPKTTITVVEEYKKRISLVPYAFIERDGKQIIVMSCHFPCTWYCRAITNIACISLDNLVQELKTKYSCENVIIGGDFNFGKKDPVTGESVEAYEWISNGVEFSNKDDYPWDNLARNAEQRRSVSLTKKWDT